MQINFHGAANIVTGSKHLLTLESGHRILLDCGMFQGLGKKTFEMNSFFGFNPKDIDAVILSHAHIDHSGLIPKIVKEGYQGKIYCTPATFDLCEVMLADSAYIQESDIRFVNKRKRKQNKELLEPLYTIKDAEKSLAQFEVLEYNKELKINDFVKLTFTDNGHILGSAAVHLSILEGNEQKKLTYTGDIGRYNNSLLKNPSSFPQAAILICESTYGDRLHDAVEHAEQQILNAVMETCSVKKGKLIIPAFSLGRTQEVVYALNKLDLHGLLPNVKIFVDSPLSVNATNIMRKHMSLLNQQVQKFAEDRPDPFGFDKLDYINNKEESQALNDLKEPAIIISASGMAEAGRVKHHIMHNISDARNTILLVGYAEPQSLAGKLRHGDKEVRIYSDMYEVKAEVKVIDSFSAHADYEEMIRFLSCQDPEKVEKIFLVHGEETAQESFKEKLKEKGFNNIYIPGMHSAYFA